jgi:hypothetical protein
VAAVWKIRLGGCAGDGASVSADFGADTVRRMVKLNVNYTCCGTYCGV